MHTVHTRLWLEEPEPDNPFATRAAYCHGYDVYGQMLGQARWVDMLFLLFRGEAPEPAQAELLESLAVALANAGPRDPAVHAAMCAGVGGSTAASSLMAALAVGAGQHTGAREVFEAMALWRECADRMDAWSQQMTGKPSDVQGIWSEREHAPGFDVHGTTTPTTVKQVLDCLVRCSPEWRLRWLQTHREALEGVAQRPLALSGVAAAAFADLDLTPEQGELLYLLLRLPGAAVHALEQQQRGHRSFPFFELELLDDPEKAGA